MVEAGRLASSGGNGARANRFERMESSDGASAGGGLEIGV